MPGATFVRADLHVHVVPDAGTPVGDPAAYVDEAQRQGIRVLGITDHNGTDQVRAVIAAATGRDLLVLPGIEVTSHQGHMLALFAPDALDELADFQRAVSFRPDPADGSLRSDQSLLQLVSEVHRRSGLALLAHVDRVPDRPRHGRRPTRRSSSRSPGCIAISSGCMAHASWGAPCGARGSTSAATGWRA